MITSLAIGRGGLGRMGNNMFTIAGVIGTAVKSRQSYGFPRWLTHDNAIFGNSVDDIEDHLINELPRIPTGIHWNETGYFWGYKELFFPHGNWSIDAHMQSEKYFSHCLPLIRETFRFKDEPEQNEYVALHYRAGDFIDNHEAHHPRCSREYYQQAMAMFPEGEKFIIFSDDPDQFLKLMWPERKGQHSISSGVNYIDDFKRMKQCKSFITANSSFSLMAAILGEHPEKKIVCPSVWFGNGMPKEFDTKDIYPENAIII